VSLNFVPLKIDLKTEQLQTAWKDVLQALKELIGQPLVHTEFEKSKKQKGKKKGHKQTKEVEGEEIEEKSSKKGKTSKKENKQPEEAEAVGEEVGEEDTKKKEEEKPKVHVLEDLVGHFTIKRLLVNLQPANASELAVLILSTLETNNALTTAATINRAAFVVASALETLHTIGGQKQQSLQRSINVLKSVFTSSANNENLSPGSKVLAKTLTTISSS